ncbi:MAG: hypothetical protein ACSHXH_17190 [Marivita sp.]|uniref:thioredoxin family protein n=1 Tax=Marivita sp. TaxID=2003365 RepID=UPI003EF0AAAC
MTRKTTKARKSKHAAPSPAPKLSRRDMMGRLAIYGIGAVAVAGGGTAFALDFSKKLTEADLTVVGNGTSTIVQIHDPNCGLCQSLQKETRAAFKLCDDTAFQYRVANITSVDGAAFQSRLGLPHVTLVFFDGQGQHIHTLQGVTPAAEIKAQITRVFA